MHHDYNKFIHSLNFEVNQFNVGVKNEQAYRVQLNYADWFEYSMQNYAHIISKEQFESIIDQLYLQELDQPSRQAYKALKVNQDVAFTLDLLSLFKLYLILKVRRYQTSNHNQALKDLENRLEELFITLQLSDEEKLKLSIQNALPDFSVVNSTGALLPISMLIANVAMMKITPSTTLSFIIHIGIFLIIAGMFKNLLKKSKSKDDQAMVMAWSFIIDNNLNVKNLEEK